MNFRSNQKRREITMDLTPMIDVVFLLLIFFLVTATFTQEEQTLIPILLPEAATGELANDSSATISIAEDGSLSLTEPNAGSIEIGNLADLLRELTLIYNNEPTTTIRLRGDTNANYGRIMEIWDTARAIGFPRVNNEVFAP